MLTRHKPVCTHRDGVFVVDDVGGLHGFVRFLEGIYEGDDEVERRSSITVSICSSDCRDKCLARFERKAKSCGIMIV